MDDDGFAGYAFLLSAVGAGQSVGIAGAVRSGVLRAVRADTFPTESRPRPGALPGTRLSAGPALRGRAAGFPISGAFGAAADKNISAKIDILFANLVTFTPKYSLIVRSMSAYHTPVLLEESVSLLEVAPQGT